MQHQMVQPDLDDQPLTPLPASEEPVQPVRGSPRTWQTILWQEWRHSEDEGYARQLFELVRHTLVDWENATLIGLGGGLYSALIGYLLGLITINSSSGVRNWTLLGIVPLALACALGLAGGLLGLGASRLLSWSVWLAVVTPGVLNRKMGGLARFNLELGLGFLAGLTSWFGFMGGGFVGGWLGFFRFDKDRWPNMGFSILAGGFGAILGGLFFYSNWLGIAAGLLLGVWLGISWGSGPLGLAIIWLGTVLGLLAFRLDDWLVGWLAVGAGFGLGLLPNLAGRGIEPEDAFNYRSWYMWWRNQPSLSGVESALQLTETFRPGQWQYWQDALRRLREQKAQPERPAKLIADLSSDEWVDRFVARHALIALGGAAVEQIKTFAAGPGDSERDTAIWLLTAIEQDTTQRLAGRTAQLLCPHCLTRFGQHSVSVAWGISYSYYGCRSCHQSRELLDWPAHVIAVLDAGWGGAEHRHKNQLRVNWLKRRTLFDMTRVEIVRATDEEVERFAVQVGNDTDPYRQQRYKRVSCFIGSKCELSENTLRILRSRFGRVEKVTHASII